MTEITEDLILAKASELIMSHATDVEFLSIGETMQDDPRFEGLTDAEFDDVSERINGAISKAAVTVAWPGGHDAPNVRRLRDHLTKYVSPGETYGVQLGADMLRGVVAKWDALSARVAELESGRNQLRHIVNDQAHRIQGGLDRIDALEAELKDTKMIDEQCTATTGRRLIVQCSREAGHDDAHTAEVGGGRISWHGDTTPAGA